MKFAFLMFGAFGFALVAIVGYCAERPMDLVLRDAALGCLGTAMAGRWFWGVMDRAFAETVEIRRATAAAAAEAAIAAENQPHAAPSSSAKPATAPARPSPAPAATAKR